MYMRNRMEVLIEEMLDGQIMLGEALSEFEKLYIEKAMIRFDEHITQTASALGIHRNTLAKRVSAYHQPPKTHKRLLSRRAK